MTDSIGPFALDDLAEQIRTRRAYLEPLEVGRSLNPRVERLTTFRGWAIYRKHSSPLGREGPYFVSSLGQAFLVHTMKEALKVRQMAVELDELLRIAEVMDWNDGGDHPPPVRSR